MNIKNANPLLLGTLALIAGASCIALAPIMVKLSPLGPQASAFWRLVLSLPALLIWAIIERQSLARTATPAPVDHKILGLLAIAGFLFAGDLITWHAGIVRTSAANATFLANLTPVIVILFTWVMTRVLPSKSYFVAAFVALFGSLMLSGGAPGHDPEKLLGDGLSALTSIWYGLYVLTIARLRGTLGAGTIMLGSSLVGAVLCLGAALASGEAIWPTATGDSFLMIWWPLFILGLVVHVLGQGMLAVGFGLVAPTLASLLILWQPVLAAILGWVWLGEVLSPLQLLGGALVLFGVWLARRSA